MAKLTLADVTSGHGSRAVLNDNFALIETALENTLSRNGTSPNQMTSRLDMNSNRIINLPAAGSNSEPVTLAQLNAASVLTLLDTSTALFTQQGTGASQRTLAAKLAEFVSVLDFGAAGSGAVDDTSAIQEAINYVGGLGGGDVYFPEGTYLYTNVDMLSGVRLRGMGNAILKQGESATTPTPGFDAVGLTNVGFYGLTFDFSVSRTVHTEFIIDYRDAVEVRIDDCEFFSLKTINDRGGYCLFGDRADRVWITDNYFHDMAQEVVRMAAATKIHVTGNQFETIYRSQHASGLLNRCVIVGSSKEYVINDNMFNNVGKGYSQNSYTFSTCCIDVGNAENGTIVGNIARDVYSFLDIETSAVLDEHVLTVTGNSMEGWLNTTDVTVNHEPIGGEAIRYVKSPESPYRVVISGNVIKGFHTGIRCSSIFDSIITSNIVTNCYTSGIHCVSVRKSVISGNFVSDCSQAGTGLHAGIYVSSGATIGFSGGVISGNVMQGTEESYCLHVVSKVDSSNLHQMWVVSNNFSQDRDCLYEETDSAGYNPRGIREYGNHMRPELAATGFLIPDGTTTLSLYGTDTFYSGNTGATTVDAVSMPWGEPKLFVVNDSNTTIDFSASGIKGNGSVNAALDANDTVTFRRLFWGSSNVSGSLTLD